MTREEILDRMEVCPWGERISESPYLCARYLHTPVPCGGSCSWVFDYPKIKELEKFNQYGPDIEECLNLGEQHCIEMMKEEDSSLKEGYGNDKED